MRAGTRFSSKSQFFSYHNSWTTSMLNPTKFCFHVKLKWYPGSNMNKWFLEALVGSVIFIQKIWTYGNRKVINVHEKIKEMLWFRSYFFFSLSAHIYNSNPVKQGTWVFPLNKKENKIEKRGNFPEVLWHTARFCSTVPPISSSHHLSI